MSVLLFRLSLLGCCHKLRVHYPLVIAHIAQRIVQLFVKSMKEITSQLLLDSVYGDTLAELHSAPPTNRLHKLSHSLYCPAAAYKSSTLRDWRIPWCHTQGLICWWFMLLGHADLGTGPGQLWLHIMAILPLPSASPLCDFVLPS